MKRILSTILLLCNALPTLLGAPTDLANISSVAQPIDIFDDVESQLSIYPSDDEETSGLEGDKLIYTDFCLVTRDNVMGDIRRTTSQLVRNVFSLFLKSFEGIGSSGGSISSSSDDTMAQGESSIDGRGAGSGPVVAQIEGATNGRDGDAQMSDGGAPSPSRGIFGSVMSVLSATKNVVASSVQQSLYSIKNNMGLKTVTVVLRDACNKVENYELEMRKRFDETTGQLGGLAISSLDNVKCVTTNRILSLNRFCKGVTTAHGYFIKS